MAEWGMVQQIKGDFAEVAIERSEACKHCNACIPSWTDQKMLLTARNQCGAQVGDAVTINLAQSGFLSAVLLMYVIPALVFVLLLVITQFSGLTEWLSILIALAGVAVSFLLLHHFEPRLNKPKYTPVIDHILSTEELEELLKKS